MLLPASTGTGLAELVTDRSAESATCTLTVALLFPMFGSPVGLLTDAVSVMVVPEATALLTCTTNVKFAVALAARVAMEQVKGATEVQAHPAGPPRDTNVVLAGRVSVRTTVLAEAGPPLATVC